MKRSMSMSLILALSLVLSACGGELNLADLDCSAGQVPQYDGTAWVCVTPSTALDGLTCTSGQVAEYNGTAWVCATVADVDSLGALDCDDGQTPRWNEEASAWQCQGSLTLRLGLIAQDFTFSPEDPGWQRSDHRLVRKTTGAAYAGTHVVAPEGALLKKVSCLVKDDDAVADLSLTIWSVTPNGTTPQCGSNKTTSGQTPEVQMLEHTGPCTDPINNDLTSTDRTMFHIRLFALSVAVLDNIVVHGCMVEFTLP